MKDEYSDIIDQPHPEPKWHVRMQQIARASQFAPFSALKGYEDAIAESIEEVNTSSCNNNHTI